eukprot:6205262-Alexandrium_andersonii.AAC.1
MHPAARGEQPAEQPRGCAGRHPTPRPSQGSRRREAARFRSGHASPASPRPRAPRRCPSARRRQGAPRATRPCRRAPGEALTGR